MTTWRTRNWPVLLGAAGVLTLAACRTETPEQHVQSAAEGRLADGDGADERVTSMVRMINAVPGADGVEVSADDNALFTGVDYKSVTPYTELRDNIARFRLKAGGRDTTLATNNEIVADGSRYTVVALVEADGGVQLRVLHDELVPDSGKTRVRVVHGIRGAGDLEVRLGAGDALFESVRFGAEAGYKEIDPVSATLVIRARSGGRQLLRKEMKLVAGHSYTIVVAGSGTGNAVQRVDAIVVDDQAIAASR